MKLCILLLHTDGKGLMKTHVQYFYFLIFLFIILGCVKEEISLKSTQYILKQRFGLVIKTEKLYQAKEFIILLLLKQSMHGQNQVGFLIVGKEQ